MLRVLSKQVWERLKEDFFRSKIANDLLFRFIFRLTQYYKLRPTTPSHQRENFLLQITPTKLEIEASIEMIGNQKTL